MYFFIAVCMPIRTLQNSRFAGAVFVGKYAMCTMSLRRLERHLSETMIRIVFELVNW